VVANNGNFPPLASMAWRDYITKMPFVVNVGDGKLVGDVPTIRC